MAGEQAFAKLLRSSGLARFSRSIPQVYTRPAHAAGEKDLTFGMKRAFPDRYWGKRLQNVQVTGLDAEYGYAEFVEADEAANQYDAWRELIYTLGNVDARNALASRIFRNPPHTQPEDAAAQEATPPPPPPPHANVFGGTHRPSSTSRTVVGRLLNRVEGGYAVGIGGFVAFLPATSVPPSPHLRFSHHDFVRKRAHEFVLKHAEMGPDGRTPYIVVSLRP